MMNELKQNYKEKMIPSMIYKFEYKSVMQVPKIDKIIISMILGDTEQNKKIMKVTKIEKIIINMGVGDAVQNSKMIDSAVDELTQISGQKPVVTRAKNSIAGYRLREGMPIGTKVTLRGERMYEFLQNLIRVA